VLHAVIGPLIDLPVAADTSTAVVRGALIAAAAGLTAGATGDSAAAARRWPGAESNATADAKVKATASNAVNGRRERLRRHRPL